MTKVLPWGSRTSTGVFAAPCSSGNTTAEVDVTPNGTVDLTSVFNCEGGDFEVVWFGEVQLNGTVVIGSGTTVRISGERNSNGGNSSLSNNEVVANLTSGLSLPLGLTSAAVGVAPPNITISTNRNTSFGPMFSVDHGHLTLKDMVIRGGFTANTTDENDKIGDVEQSGGGVFAVNSTVSVTRCEFNDNYAQHLGGGIFVNASTLHVFDSIFRFCKAGYVATIVEPDVPGAGGGINVSKLMSKNASPTSLWIHTVFLLYSETFGSYNFCLRHFYRVCLLRS